ncbi:MAG: alpha/beta fold hydrolase [Saprospirales bacterium]|nr:alpha/beta fold hydrolase [Saprospirales bacterium]MBK8489652.1 alpha/beta fold hydrolase [Saprospirales bacterium]
MELNHKVLGHGDPVIILHGLFGTLDNWQTVGRLLSEDYQVFLVDQRNHGRSPDIPEHTYEGMVNDLDYFMEFNWIHHTYLIGHSMGGKTAMQYALHHPDKVRKLVVIDIAPKAYAGGHEGIFEALRSLDLTQVKERGDAEAHLRKYIDSYGVLQFLLKNLSRGKDGTYSWKMNLPVLHEHYQDILGEVEGDTPYEGPTLFIRGSESPYIQDSDWPRILDFFPNAQLATVEGAGHWVHADAPEELLELLRTFLAD